MQKCSLLTSYENFIFCSLLLTMFVKASKRITMKNYSNKFKVEALWCNNRRLIICSSWSGVGPDQTLLKLQILILFFGGCFAWDCYLLFPAQGYWYYKWTAANTHKYKLLFITEYLETFYSGLRYNKHILNLHPAPTARIVCIKYVFLASPRQKLFISSL